MPSPELVNEQQVLDEFLTSEPTNGVLVAPVLGESGTGKSHLVRWVDAKIAAPNAAKRHVIYLKKTDTSLKNVVEQLLGRTRQGPEFDDIRTKVGSLGSGVTLETMEARILDALAEAVEHHEATGGGEGTGRGRTGWPVLPRPTVPRAPAPPGLVREAARQARLARAGCGRAGRPAGVHRRRTAVGHRRLRQHRRGGGSDPEDCSRD